MGPTSVDKSIDTRGDIVPRKDVAHWRARVNIAMTLGRSAGGPLGGWLIDLVGWRWYENLNKNTRIFVNSNEILGRFFVRLH